METHHSHSSRNCSSFVPPQLINPHYDRLKTAIAEAHPTTAEHSVRVRICAAGIGLSYGLGGSELTTLAIAAEIHDIGKLRVPEAILNKSKALSSAEWEIVRQHPMWGARMAASAFPHYPDVARCVMAHHERLDGSGYPCGLMGDQIPILARIIAVADAFIALTEDRTYRPAYDTATALNILSHEERDKYDQNVVDLLRRMLRPH